MLVCIVMILFFLAALHPSWTVQWTAHCWCKIFEKDFLRKNLHPVLSNISRSQTRLRERWLFLQSICDCARFAGHLNVKGWTQSLNFCFNLLFLQVLRKWNRILPKVVHNFHPISKPSSSKSRGQNFQKKWKHHQPSKGTHCFTLTPHGSNVSHNWISLESVAGRTSQIKLNFDLKKMMLFVWAFTFINLPFS